MSIELIMVIVVCASAVAAIASLSSLVIVTLSSKVAEAQKKYVDKIAADKVLELATNVASDLLKDTTVATTETDRKAAEKVLALAAKVASDLVKNTESKISG